MNTSVNRTWLTIGFAFCVFCASNARGQKPLPAHSSESSVRVIDINKVFKTHAGYKKQLEEFRRYVSDVEADLREKRKVVENLQKELITLKPGSPEYKDMARVIVECKGSFNTEATVKRNDLLEREAKIYYKTYQEIQTEVKKHCDRNKVSLVIRYNSEATNPNDRTSVMRQVANPIVYQQSIDITDVILKAFDGRKGEEPEGDDAGE